MHMPLLAWAGVGIATGGTDQVLCLQVLPILQ